MAMPPLETFCIPPLLMVVEVAMPAFDIFWVALSMVVKMAKPPLETFCIPALLMVVDEAIPVMF
ncbi:hypothetical protein ABF73_22150 [Enterobacter roggenkampii]|nr:hypothetical protein ABF73_22150 [Enterobacter roggenkampii]